VSDAELFIDGTGHLCARCPFDAKDAVKAVTGARWDPSRNAWRWPMSDATLLAVIDGLWAHPAVSDIDLTFDLDERYHGALAARGAATHKVADDVPPIDLELFGAPPHWIHQRRAFHFARSQRAAGIFIGMGGGKSRVAVDLCRDAGDERVLILCPKAVVGVWPKQFQLYAPDLFQVVAPRFGPRGGELSLA
jgi:hypothetical protein